MHREDNPFMPPESGSYRVEVVTSQDVLETIAKLRVQAWSANGELPSFIANQDIRNDEHERHGIHLVVMSDGCPVAAAKTCIHQTPQECPEPESLLGYEDQLVPPIATFNRLVVHPDFRRLGFSLLLTKQRIAIAREKKCGSIVVVAERPSRMRQLEDLGFNRLGPTKIRYVSFAESILYLLRM
jgi:hypothetical protein